MNECHFIGRLADQPKLVEHTRNDGKVVPLASFTIAVNREHRKADGTRVEHTQFLDFEAWDSAASTVAKYGKKGELIIIDQAAACSHIEELKDGTKINRIVFRVLRFNFQSVFFGKRKKIQDDTK